MNRGFALLHKTLAFVSGAGVAYIGYISLSNQLVFRNNHMYNELLKLVKNPTFTNGMEPLPTSKDYAQITRVTISSCWNRSILYLHRYLSQWLHNDKPFDEKVESMIENYKPVDVSQKNENEQPTSEIIEKEIPNEESNNVEEEKA